MLEHYNLILTIALGLFTLAGSLWAVARKPSKRLWDVVSRLEATADAVLGTEENIGLISQVETIKRELRLDSKSTISSQVARLLAEQRAALDEDRTRAFFSCSKGGAVEWASKTFLRWFGAHLIEIRGSGWLGLVADDERERVADEWARAVNSQRSSTARFFINGDVDGVPTRMFMALELSPIFNANGDLIGWRGSMERIG